ncbi:MAG: hypothetical protein ABWW69_00230, partial [Pyrodictiaceae archaeon]
AHPRNAGILHRKARQAIGRKQSNILEAPERRVSSARSRGFAVKYLVVADMVSENFRVEPSEVPVSSPLASASGEYNVVEFHLERETITLMGPAGSAWRTAKVMITDALELLCAFYQ